MGILFTLTACSEQPKNEFYIMQDGDYFYGNEVSIEKKNFTISSSIKGYSIVMAKEPIKNLADHMEIVKLNATSGAWYPNELPFYQVSDLLSDRDACDVYYGNQGKECQVFVKEKTRLGFRRHYAYTFAEYMISENSIEIKKMGKKEMKDMEVGQYHLYFFRSEDKMGNIARAQRVTRMKVNIK